MHLARASACLPRTGDAPRPATTIGRSVECLSLLASALEAPSGAPRPRLPRLNPRVASRTLIAAVRTQPSMPSLAVGLAAAILRARGDEAHVLELEPSVERWAEPLVSGLLEPTDRILLLDAPTTIRSLPRVLGGIPVSRDLGGLGCSIAELDLPPVPDFSDFAAERTRVLPIAAHAPSGRHRGIAEVLHEIREYARRHSTPDLVFVDHALNRAAGFLPALIDAMQVHAPGVQWMAAVSVDPSHEPLCRRTVRAAAHAGLRVLVIRASGATDPTRVEEVRRLAAEAGIAVRIDASAAQPRFALANLAAAVHHATVFDSIALKD